MIDQIKVAVKEKLKEHPSRYQHVIGVYETAIKLADHYGIDQEKTAIAAIFHDYSKYDSIEIQTAFLDESIIKKYSEAPVMYHAFAAAEVLKRSFDIQDEDILNAIRYHVYGRENMSFIEKIIFISDYCEPNRKFTDTNYIFELAMNHLDLATEYCMKLTIDDLRKKGLSSNEEQEKAYIFYQEVNRGQTR